MAKQVNGIGELIDTLWNVNFLDRNDIPVESIELIDTLWNVNNFGEGSSGVEFSN